MYDYVLFRLLHIIFYFNKQLLYNSITIKSFDECNWTVGQGNNWYPAMIH